MPDSAVPPLLLRPALPQALLRLPHPSESPFVSWADLQSGMVSNSDQRRNDCNVTMRQKSSSFQAFYFNN
jgi:hypothetical protein